MPLDHAGHCLPLRLTPGTISKQLTMRASSNDPVYHRLSLVPCLSRPRTTLVHERHRLRAGHVASIQSFEPKACVLDHRGNRAVEMAPAANPLPYRRQRVLPPHHVRIWRATMLNEQEAPARLSARRISWSARLTSGIVHNVQVVTTVSTLALSNGILSAEPSIKFTGKLRLPTCRAMFNSLGEGSSPITCCTSVE